MSRFHKSMPVEPIWTIGVFIVVITSILALTGGIVYLLYAIATAIMNS